VTDVLYATVTTFMAADGATVVQVDTLPDAGRIRVNLNDASIWDGDPERDAPPGAHLARKGPGMTGIYTRIKALPERARRRLAADYAEHVLGIWETAHPEDARPRAAIKAARAYDQGEATREELNAARRAAHAATTEATEAAEAAATAAAYAAEAVATAATTTAAAEAVATAAAFAAADAATYDAERAWQLARLAEYEGKTDGTHG
jgi:hypothetical protein